MGKRVPRERRKNRDAVGKKMIQNIATVRNKIVIVSDNVIERETRRGACATYVTISLPAHERNEMYAMCTRIQPSPSLTFRLTSHDVSRSRKQPRD